MTGADSGGGELAAVAAEMVLAVQDSTEDRFHLAADFYLADSGDRSRYGRAELSFLRWEIARGVLNSPAAERPGSPWWRAVNNRLLRDKVEADLLSIGRPGSPSSRAVQLWVEFIAAPSPRGWYRAHNASITAGYLDHQRLAMDELPAECFLMNVALGRALYAHAMLARPRLALGGFAPLGPLLADPRRYSVGFFLDLRRVFPEHYPLGGITVDELIAMEGHLPRALDYGIITQRAAALYELATTSLEEPRIAELISDGAPCYAWPPENRSVWSASSTRLLPRIVAFATRAGAGQ
ncbi:MAG TPA: hypothetical protein VGH72_24475 [Pseudonocardia sp.]